MVTNKKKYEAGNGVLKGMDAIESFSGFNRVILMRWKREYPLMPMTKPGGIYLADPDKLRQFLKDMAAGATEKYLEAPPEPESTEGNGGEGGAQGDGSEAGDGDQSSGAGEETKDGKGTQDKEKGKGGSQK